jgi:hypothetical protein
VRRLCAALVLASLLVAPAARAEHWDEVIEWAPRVVPLRGAGEVEIHAPVGRVRLVSGSDGRVLVRATLRLASRDPEALKAAARSSTVLLHAEGDRVQVALALHDPRHGQATAELTVEVPPRATVRVRDGAAGVEAAALSGPLEVSTQTGGIQVGLAGPATVRVEASRGRIVDRVGLSVTSRGHVQVGEGRIGGGGPQVFLHSVHGAVAMQPVTGTR